MGVAAPIEQEKAIVLAGLVHSDAYKGMLRCLVSLRQDAGLSQADLSAQLRKPKSFVGKYELGERRLDVIELLVILRALGSDFPEFWSQAGIDLPDTLRS